MKQFFTAMIISTIFCGMSHGQEMPSNYEHLKSFEARIGQWIYEGPILEDIADIVAKGDDIDNSWTAKWVLGKNAIETNLSVTVKKSGLEYTSKHLIGWDAENNRIINGGMDSFGGHELSTVIYDPATKTWTSKSKGSDIKGEETSSTFVATLVDKDSLQVQAFDRKGGLAQGDSPKYTYKRVKK